MKILRNTLLAIWSLALTQGVWAVEVDLTRLVNANRAAVVNVSSTYVAKRSVRRNTLPQPEEDSPLHDFFKYFRENPNAPQVPEEEIPQTPREYKRYGGGSGLIISADGYILTNTHVIDGADEVTVALSDRREFTAEVVGSDERSDVAMLKIDADNLPVVKIGDSDTLQVGQWVVAIGSPFGFEHSATQGIVSALSRSLPDETYVPFIQTDVAVNPGNSGGPLFNLEGEVIGINSQIYSRTGGYMGLSFAIPINLAMHVSNQLKAKGYVSRGWLGVLIQQVNNDLAQSFGLDKPAGALVAQVLPDSPAQKAGVEVGDIILKYNGKTIEVYSDLPNLVGMTAVDDTATLSVKRQGEDLKLPVVIAELPDDSKKGEVQKASAPGNPLKLSVADLSEEEREQHAVKHGVLVKQVQPGPADMAGIRAGDIILQFNRKDVKDSAHFNELTADLPAGKPIPVLIQRQDGAFFITVEIPET